MSIISEASQTQTPKIRAARPEDYPHIIACAEKLHEENGHCRINYPKAEAAIIDAINKKQSVIGLIGPVGDIQGIIMLRFASMWNSDEIFLEELFLYVPPEHRKSPNAKALLYFAMNTAKKLEMDLFIGVLSNHRTKAKLKLYEKHLGQPVGGYYFIQHR